MFQTDPTDDVIIDEAGGDVITDEGAANESGDPSAPNQSVYDEVDEKGVSYKNRFFELERKYENLNKSIPQMIQEAATAAANQTGSQVKSQGQPEYSINDYLRAKAKDPENASYYDAQIMELQKKEIANTVKSEIQQLTRQQSEAQIRQQAEAWAMTNFPQLRDINNPFTQEVIRQFNARPEALRAPQDFAIAAELVAGRMGIKPVTQVNPQQDKVKQLEKKNKSMLKERTLEGDGRGNLTPNTVTQKQKDYAAAQERGDFTAYIAKWHLKPKESE